MHDLDVLCSFADRVRKRHLHTRFMLPAGISPGSPGLQDSKLPSPWNMITFMHCRLTFLLIAWKNLFSTLRFNFSVQNFSCNSQSPWHATRQ
jgi:hypothetical protein